MITIKDNKTRFDEISYGSSYKRVTHNLFLTGFLQVFLVAMNTVFVSSGLVLPMLITGFLISLVWSWNIKKIAFSTIKDRILYSSGAATGTFCGYFLATFIKNII
jgi:hypothetical protein